ncbi:thioredoxin family protein [Marinifilum fragile]|uniref:thioredoxin family protein n=1 Tax=Marinifilum fragile TaxID=570161 RepID=UPI0006D0F9C1|nr:thioredoxin domain-containing protein [Marinifilum fragile]
MKIRNILIVFVFLSFITACAEKQPGIDFKNITFNEALKKAEKQNKLIFIDFYTEWCGPCKRLAKGPFLDPEVGDFYNENFISLKLDAEKEGLDVAKIYKVNSYPTLMFLKGDGTMIYRGGGNKHGSDMIGFGEKALQALEQGNNLEKLQTEFKQKKNDEAFLKQYISKMTEYGVSPTQGIEAWLRIQTEIEEDSKEMFQYLLNSQKYFMADSYAWNLVDKYYDSYTKLANKSEKRRLDCMKSDLLRNTISEAYRLQSPELMHLFINKNKALGNTEYRHKSMEYYELMCQLLSNEIGMFKKQAITYVENIKTVQPVDEVRKADKAEYNSRKKSYEKRTDAGGKNILKELKEGMQANQIVKDIVDVAHYYLQYADNEKDFEYINDWISYCNRLIPNKYLVENLQANNLYKQGETTKAIELKTKALSDFPYNYKKRVNVEHELGLMKQGEGLLTIAVNGK